MDGDFAGKEGVWGVYKHLCGNVVQDQASNQDLTDFDKPGGKPADEMGASMKSTLQEDHYFSMQDYTAPDSPTICSQNASMHEVCRY